MVSFIGFIYIVRMQTNRAIFWKSLIFFLFSFTSIHAQTNLDSLYTVWQDTSRKDSVRIKAMDNLIWDGYLFSQQDSALFYVDELLDFTRKKKDYWGIAVALHIKGIAFYLKDDYEKALEASLESIEYRKKTDDKRGLASTLGNIGLIYDTQGDYTSALDIQKESLKIRKEINDKEGIGIAYASIGNLYFLQAEYDEAIDFYNRSTKIAEELGDKKGVATNLGNLGLIYEVQGNYMAALKAQEESLSIREEINFQRGVGIALNSIGMIYDSQGNYDRALDYYMRSLEVKEELNDKRGMAGILNNVGIIYDDLGEYDKAIQYYRKSLLMKEDIGDKLGIANTFTNVAAVYKALKVYDSAIYYNQRSLKLKQELGDKLGLGSVYHNMGSLYQELGEYRKAMGYYQKSIDLTREIGDRRNEVSTLIAIGMASFEQKDYNKSVINCLDALAQAEELGAIPEQELSSDCLYKSYKALGNSERALVYHEQVLMLNDSLKLQETSKKLQQMEFAKQVLADSLQQVEKDLQVEMAHQTEVRKKDRNRNLALGAGIFFLVLSGGFYSRWRYVRKSKKIIEKEKDRSENLLLNILPSEIAEELKAKGSVDARDFDQVSVLFTDFKGFTNRSEKLSARELVKEINQCFEAFDHICGNYNIEKIKTIGDAYMAGGGLPVPSEDAVKNTVLAALEMQAFMENRAAEKKATNEIPFEMRVGIHTGPVVAGIVGVKKFQYDIWGDTVNTASRMESSGEVGKINISQDTYAIIKDDPQFSFTARGKIKAKGKGEVEMYFVALKKAA